MSAATAADAREILLELVHQRRQLQRDGADSTTLEANRLAIVYWRRELARARRRVDVTSSR